jgi:hypothetical protein
MLIRYFLVISIPAKSLVFLFIDHLDWRKLLAPQLPVWLVTLDVIVNKMSFTVIWIGPSLQRIGAVSHSANRMEGSMGNMHTWAMSSFFHFLDRKERQSWEKKCYMWLLIVICWRNGLHVTAHCYLLT